MVASRKSGRRERGNAVLEMAFVFVPLFMLIFGIIDFSMVMFLRTLFSSAVREGSRYAITYQVNPAGSCQDESIRRIVQANAMGFLTADPTLPNTNSAQNIWVNYYKPDDLTTPVAYGASPPGNQIDPSKDGPNIVEVSIRNFNYNWMAPFMRSTTPMPVYVAASDRLESVNSSFVYPCR